MFDNYIVKGIGGFYYVKTGGSLVECKPKGIFRKAHHAGGGNIVRLETDGGAPVIADILPRKNVFVRPPVANVDQFFIVVSTVQPVPSTLVIDKLSAIAVDKGTACARHYKNRSPGRAAVGCLLCPFGYSRAVCER
ncbi:MAG: hypothetical protein ACLVJ8_03785 [Ruthenibacterium lactatiformans]